MVIFTILIIFSATMIVNTKLAENWAEKVRQKTKESDPNVDQKQLDDLVNKIKGSIPEIGWAMLVFTIILGLTIAFGWCYNESTLNRTFNRSEKLLAQKRIEDSENEIQKAIQRNQETRSYYEQKYPDLANSRSSKGSKK